MRNYNTQQRQILLEYFHSHTDKCLSTTEIINHIASPDISKSAIYRNLVALEKEGKVRRTTKAGDRKTYFYYVDHDDCRGVIHVSCMKCGKTTHVSRDVSNHLAQELKDEDEFAIDNQETIIYGLCKDCQK